MISSSTATSNTEWAGSSTARDVCKVAAEVQMVGNTALMKLPKVAFLSSRRIASDDVLRCYDWACKVRDTNKCIVSGFQSPLEKDVLRFLLRGKVPIILVLARRLWRKMPEELRGPINEGRLLIVSPVSVARASASAATIRNRWILVVWRGSDPSDTVDVIRSI